MTPSYSVAECLDAQNHVFTSRVTSQLADLSDVNTVSLKWLMLEHYQFSARNTAFLASAAETAKKFPESAIEQELRRNLAEESNHANMYRSALSHIGIEVDKHKDYIPTSYFFYRISELISDAASRMIGAIYATETAAIFEHTLFRRISSEVIMRNSLENLGKPLIAFHDMHLSGVEQSHKDELGIFLRCTVSDSKGIGKDGVDATLALNGGQRAIRAMEQWWRDLLSKVSPIVAIHEI